MTTSSRKTRESGDDFVELKRYRLKPSAIPCIFPNLSKYLSKNHCLNVLILAPLHQDMDLCYGKELSTSIEHPLRNKERLFLLFDFIHNLKNIFYNFVNRKRYHAPEIANANAQHILGGKRLAQFEHINRLYRWKSIYLSE